MSAPEPFADRGGSPIPGDGIGEPPRSAAVSGPDRPPAERPGRRRRLLLIVVGFLLVLGLVNAFVIQPFTIPSPSMENTLRVGDRVLVDKLAYRFGGHVRRGDVVVFDGTGSFVQDGTAPGGLAGALRRLGSHLGLAQPPGGDFVKRVVGVGGDRVVCCDKRGRITVDGVPLDESAYLFPGETASSVPFDVQVPPGKLWVMGDHRSDSSDSRDHLGDPGGGFVPVDKVIGRAVRIIYPFGHWRHLQRPAAFDAMDKADTADAADAADAAGRNGRHGDQG